MAVFADSRRREELNRLRIYVARALQWPSATNISGTQVVFEAAPQGGAPIRLETSLESLGFTRENREKRRLTDHDFRLPLEIEAGLEGAFGAPSQPVWLELDPINSDLPLVPWERLLSHLIRAPIMRVAPHSLPHAQLASPPHVVVCASAPVAKESFALPEITRGLVAAAFKSLGAECICHVFTDSDWFHPISQRLASLGAGAVVHDPADAAQFGEAARSTDVPEEPGRVENPWLLWILAALRGHTADVVQFLCHGFLAMEQGAIAVAESPLKNSDRRTARFIGPRQLNAFLARLGAVSVGFSSPPHNYSSPGLRLLAHQTGALWPGPVLFHDLERDPGSMHLEDGYRHLFGSIGAPPPDPSAVSMYAYPTTGPQPTRQAGFGAITKSALAFSASEPPLELGPASRDAPTWAVASQRYMEQSAAEVVEVSPDSERQYAAQGGISDALDRVSEILARHSSGGTS